MDSIQEKLNDLQLTDPWSLNTNEDLLKNKDSDEFNWQIKNDKVELPSQLNNLKFIISDILAGDVTAANHPEYKNLNMQTIIKAINWLTESQAISDTTRSNLIKQPYLLNFKSRPPSMEEFLTYSYIGPQAETMYTPVKQSLIDFWDPIKPYRTMVLQAHIGFGKPAPLNSKIYETNTKWFYMGDAKPGMQVQTPFGYQSKIIAVHPQGVQPTYKLKLSDGRVAKCGLHHLWNVSYRKNEAGEKIWENVETKYMIDNKHKFKFEIYNTIQ